MINPTWLIALLLTFACALPVQAQETPAESKASESADKPSATEQVKESTGKLAEQAKGEIEKISEVVDQDPRAKTAAAGILQPIYAMAEKLAFPAFYWVAFALMTAGVISYALQLVLGKLVVLARMGFSVKEILSDGVALAISLFGLVLTTQAATENSSFTQSPASVLSSAALGIVAGIILYFWGQSHELQAAAGRSVAAVKK